MHNRWLDVDKPWVDNPAFIVHFAGCGMCSSGFHPERLGECDVEYIRIFAESFGHLKDAGALPLLALTLHVTTNLHPQSLLAGPPSHQGPADRLISARLLGPRPNWVQRFTG